MLVVTRPRRPTRSPTSARPTACRASRRVAPWQPWFFGRGGDAGPTPAFEWTYHFFWGLEDVIGTFLDMWNQVETNKAVGGLFPNDGDGNAWGDPERRLPASRSPRPATRSSIPGRYENLNQDFTAADQRLQGRRRRDRHRRRRSRPTSRPSGSRPAAGLRAQGRVDRQGAAVPREHRGARRRRRRACRRRCGGARNHPYASSLTGPVGDGARPTAYTEATGNQWTQPIGFVHALFEVAIAALVAAGGTDKTAVRDAVAGLVLDTIVGTVRVGRGQPVPNVAKTKLVGGQWRDGRHARPASTCHRRQLRQPRRADRGHGGAHHRWPSMGPTDHRGSSGVSKRFGALTRHRRPELRARARRGARHRRAQRRRQDDDAQPDRRRPAPVRGHGPASTAIDVTGVPAHRRCRRGHRPDGAGPAPVRGAHRVRERARRRLVRRPAPRRQDAVDSARRRARAHRACWPRPTCRPAR